jgi:hypothetical protein
MGATGAIPWSIIENERAAATMLVGEAIREDKFPISPGLDPFKTAALAKPAPDRQHRQWNGHHCRPGFDYRTLDASIR